MTIIVTKIGLPTSGLKILRSTSPPNKPVPIIVPKRASPQGTPASNKAIIPKAPQVKNSPWAKLKT